MMNPSELETLDAPRLRELTRELVEQLSAQQHQNSESAQSIESLKRELLFKSTRIEQLSYELARYKRLRFARSSEALNGVQASLLQEAEATDTLVASGSAQNSCSSAGLQIIIQRQNEIAQNLIGIRRVARVR
jgi:hypothetical protein